MLAHVLLLALAVTQTPAEDSNPLTAASDYVQSVIRHLPAWETDTLAQYEQPELAAVREDVKHVLGDIVEDDVLQDTERLKRDWAKLVALDNQFKYRDVI